MGTLTDEVMLEESQSTEAEELKKYLQCFIAAGESEKAWWIFHEELVDTVLALAAEGYDLTFNSYVQELIEIGKELFGYVGGGLLGELYGEEEI